MRINNLKKNKFIIKGLLLFFLFLLVGFSFKKDPLISVVMPVYNQKESLLSAAIESILSQTYTNFEFIIIDDGSTDRTSDIIHAYQKKDARIRLLQNKKNQGVSYSRQKGNEAARGRYIVVMDSDDKAYPLLLERLFEFMETHPTATVAYPVHDIYMEEYPDKIHHHSLPLYDIFFDNVVQNTGAIFKRDFFVKQNIKYDSTLKAAEDYDFWVQIFFAGGKIYKIYSEPLLLIRLHNTNSPEYYAYMANKARNISQSLLAFFDVPSKYFKNKCLVLKKVFQSPHNFLTSDEQTQALQKYCPNDPNAFLVKHPYWEDYFILNPSQKRVCRYSNENECAQVLSWKNNILKIKWDGWGVETFKLNKQQELELQ